MEYVSLKDYRYAWFFKHQEMPVDEQALMQIKPLSESYANQIWHQLISKKANHPDLFLKDDWPLKKDTWLAKDQWQALWESDDQTMPLIVNEHLDWEGNTVIYFCYHADNIIETTWEVFSAHWKNFLFLDNGPILLGKRRNKVLQFFENGEIKVGEKGVV